MAFRLPVNVATALYNQEKCRRALEAANAEVIAAITAAARGPVAKKPSRRRNRVSAARRAELHALKVARRAARDAARATVKN